MPVVKWDKLNFLWVLWEGLSRGNSNSSKIFIYICNLFWSSNHRAKMKLYFTVLNIFKVLIQSMFLFLFYFKFLPFYTFALFLTFFLFSVSATLTYFNLLNKVCSTSKVSCARICNNEILFQLWPFWFWWLLLLAFYFNGHHFSNSLSSNPNL